MKPLIGLSPDQDQHQKWGKIIWVKENYLEAIFRHGGMPLPLPYTAQSKDLDSYLEILSGLIITGGDFDIPPHYYGEKDAGQSRIFLKERTRFEHEMIGRAWQKQLPLLGICGGAQLLNVFRGGTLLQDVSGHEGCEHEIVLEGNGRIGTLLGKDRVLVNSTHHQAMGKLGKDLQVTARAPDGVVEAIEVNFPPPNQDFFCLGVQWHPEALLDPYPEQGGIFKGFVQAAKAYRRR